MISDFFSIKREYQWVFFAEDLALPLFDKINILDWYALLHQNLTSWILPLDEVSTEVSNSSDSL